MSSIAIQVERLGKKYQIGVSKETSYSTLRETLSNRVKGIFKAKQSRDESKDFWALQDVSFTVNQGEVIGIIGANGAGKSTLLKLLSRITEPTTGQITLNGRVASLLEVGTGFHPELTGRENIFLSGTLLGMNRKEIRQQFDAIVAFSGVEKFVDTPVKRYSSGMRVRLGFAVAAHLQAEILLIDEVLAVGDAAFQEKCLGKMGEVADGGRTILFVSHNLGVITNLCKKSILIKDGQMVKFENTSDVIDGYLDLKGKHKVYFENKPLQSIEVKQDEDIILIHATYSIDHEITIPCLGFVIYDQLGHPVSGGNPIFLGQANFSKNYSQNGTINILIRQPKLLDGYYSFSFWFGIDGFTNIQVERNCLKIHISNMANLYGDFSAQELGRAAVICEYEFC